jgi:capsular polysaccharide biosynthesis protein
MKMALVLAAMAVTSASLVQTPTYEASAQMLVGWQQGDQWANSGGSGEEIRTLEYREPPIQEIMHAIGTRGVAQEAIQRLGLRMDPDELLDNLTVEQIENTSFLERVMHSGENRIEMRIPRSGWLLHDLRFPHS